MCTVINNVFVLCVIRYYQVVQQHFLNYITMLSQNIRSIHISDTSISDFWSYSLLFLYVFIEKKKAVKWTGFLTTTGFLCQQQTEKQNGERVREMEVRKRKLLWMEQLVKSSTAAGEETTITESLCISN